MGVHQPPEVYAKVKELLGIPIDEPIFVLRAQDEFAVPALSGYEAISRGSMPIGYGSRGWHSNLEWVKNDFIRWQNDNPEKVKVPD